MNCNPAMTLSLFRLACVFLSLAMLTGCALFRAGDDDVPASAKKAVNAAYSQMGKKYKYGGASPKNGFDCSGLVYWSYMKTGVRVPRITRDQARTGFGVSSGHMREGDIVVFRTGNGPNSLHTGLYAGGKSFIHSPRRGKVVCMERIDKPYWKGKLVAIRRVVR